MKKTILVMITLFCFVCFATTTLTINGTAYNYPETGDLEWGTDATNWASAVTSGALFKSGGLFTLTAETDFGSAYGIKSLYYKSRTSTPATAGQIRFAKTDVLSFRNNANTANLDMGTSSDRLQWDGVNLVTISSTDTLTNKTLTSPVLNGSLTGTAISTDSTLVTESTTVVPTESAVKGYVDTEDAKQDTLAEMGDVQITSAALNDVLVYNGTKWADATTLAGLTLTSPVLNSPEINTAVTGTAIDTDSTLASDSTTKLPTVSAVKGYVDTETAAQDALSELVDVTITAPISIYSVLAYNGTKWVNSGINNDNIDPSAAIAVNKLAAVTANKALVTDASGFMSASATTDTEIGYVSGVTSAIQTQINAKATNPLTTNGDMIYGVSSTPTRLAVGAQSTVLTSDGTYPVWIAPTFLTDPTTTQGDLIVRGAAAIDRLALGTSSYFLMSNGTTTVWRKPILRTNYTSPEIIVSAYIINTTGSWSVGSQEGTWISSITDAGTGKATLNVTDGIFSTAPRCSCTAVTGNAWCMLAGVTTTSSIPLNMLGSGPADVETSFHILCLGYQEN